MFFSRFRRSAPRLAAFRIPDGIRVYAIGDVHGRLDLLRRLLDKIVHDGAMAANARIIFLGDYIDRGADSRSVLDMLIAGVAERGWTCLKGNHEAMLLAALDGSLEWDVWLVNGGAETLFSYGIASRELVAAGKAHELGDAVLAAIPTAHIDFMRNLDLTLTLGDYFFCHAGIRPGVALDRQVEGDLLWIRDVFTQSTADHGKRIVHGHTPTIEPEILPNRINIDTGAYLTNRLSCVVLEGDAVRIIHS
ncbi:MAG TPA: metallophosphoesterase family protein [Ancylobacter sp.]